MPGASGCSLSRPGGLKMGILKATVVIPAYNASRTVERTVRSFFRQTVQNFEIIIIDDGSTDRTLEICRDLQKDSPVPVEIVSQKNRKQSAARNVGIRKARGEYVVFFDADDLVEESYIEKMIGAACGELCLDIVCCSFDLVFTTGEVRRRETGGAGLDLTLSGKEALLRILREKLEVWTGSAIYKRGLLMDNNVFFDEEMTMGQDIEFRWRAFYHANKVALVPQILAHYVQHEHSVTRSFDPVKYPPSTWLDPAGFLDFLKDQEARSELLEAVVSHEVIPIFTVRRLRNYILFGTPDRFWNALEADSTRKALRNGFRIGHRKPGLALKCFILLNAPKMFFDRYASQRAQQAGHKKLR